MNFSGYQLAQPLKDLDGNVISERDDRGQLIKEGEGTKPLSVKTVIRQALVANVKDIPEDEKKKFEDYQLASKVLNVDPEGNLEMTSEEITQIKRKVSYVWGIEIYGFIVDLLEGRNKDWKVTNQSAE